MSEQYVYSTSDSALSCTRCGINLGNASQVTYMNGNQAVCDVCLNVDYTNSITAENASLKARVRELEGVVSQIYNDLPTNRDWLNPDLEREIKAVAQDTK